MISEIIRPEECDISYEFDLPVMMVCNRDPKLIVVLTAFHPDDDNSFCYGGYCLTEHYPGAMFSYFVITDDDIKNWSKFKGKVVLSNFAENE